MRLNRLALTLLFAASCAAPHAETHTRGPRHALAQERCGWAVESRFEDYGPVGIVRLPDGRTGCVVWFTEGGTAPHRHLIGDEKPLQIVKVPHEELPAVLFRRSGSLPTFELVLIRPAVNAQELPLVARSPHHTLVGAAPTCRHVAVRAHLCPENLWTEEHGCLGEAATHHFRRWEPGQPSPSHTQPERPACAEGPGALWFEAAAEPQLRHPAPDGQGPPPPKPPEAAESATLFGRYVPQGFASTRVTALAAYDVRRPDLDGGTERDVDLHARLDGSPDWLRYASVTLERAAPASGCQPSATLNEDGAARFVSCIDGRRVESAVQAPLPEGMRDARCQPTPAGRVCLETASDGTAVGWLHDSPYGAARGLPAVRSLRLVDGPFFEGDHLRFVGHDVAAPGRPLRWVRAPLPASPEDPVGRRQLEPISSTGGFTTGVTTLKHGAVLVTRDACTEFGGPLGGVILFPKGPPLPVDSGEALDLGRRVVLSTAVTIGSDGSGDEHPPLPAGATFFEHTSNGAYLVRRLVVVDLDARTQVPLPWGSRSPRTAGAQRVIVFAKRLDAEGTRHEVYTWPLPSGP
ncbi:MAG: hypothetical protein JNK82_40455, partial [Myxococcaceae bacterium]|nr:hypothetical protein [Myxococcaceae bacterium]